MFDEQTSNGEYKHNILVKAMEKANIPIPKIFEKISSSKSSIDIENKTFDINESFGSRFILTFDYMNKSTTAKWDMSKMKHKTPNFPPHILDAVYQKFEATVIGISIERDHTGNGNNSSNLSQNLNAR